MFLTDEEYTCGVAESPRPLMESGAGTKGPMPGRPGGGFNGEHFSHTAGDDWSVGDC